MPRAISKNPRNIRWFAVPRAVNTFNGAILDFLIAEYGGQPHAAKRLARVAGASPRSAENWLTGLNAPSGERLADLAAAHPALERQIVRHIAERRARRRVQSDAVVAATRARLKDRAE